MGNLHLTLIFAAGFGLSWEVCTLKLLLILFLPVLDLEAVGFFILEIPHISGPFLLPRLLVCAHLFYILLNPATSNQHTPGMTFFRRLP